MNVEITLPREARLGKVAIDGKPIEGITRIVLLAEVGNVTKLRLTVLPSRVDVVVTDPDLRVEL